MIVGATAIRDIQIEGIEETTVMGLGQSKEVESHIIKVLTENYKYPIESSIREAASNALDSHVMSNKLDTPFHVRLYKNETGNYNLEIEDFGLGMNEQDFDYYYMKIGNSSKRGVAGVLGFYGCGAKAPLSFLDSYEVITRKNGIEYKFLIFKGEERPEKTKIYEKATEKGNGVLIKLVIDRKELSEAKTAIKQQLCYFKTAYIQIEGDNFDYLNAKIFENDLFSWSEIYPSSEMHINFGGVHYPIDWDILKINKLYIPIGIKIAPDNGINPFFNRESLEYNALCKQTIKNTISKIADYFVEKYNSQQKDEYELLEVFDRIKDTDKYVTLGNEEFQINDLLQYSTVQPKELKIKGLEIKKPEYYWDNRFHIFDEYISLVDYTTNSWVTKRPSTPDFRDITEKGVKLIEVNRTPSGLIKKFLLQKYSGKIKFISKVKQRKLGKKAYNLRRDWDYMYILNLVMKPKDTWRQRINEWQFVENQFKSKIINELDVENSKEYLEWLTKHKEEQKLNRSLSTYQSKSNYKRLNKTAEDITIQLASPKDIGVGCKFVKKAVKITDLNKLYKSTKALHIYFPEEQKERAKEYYELLGAKYSICILSPREIKRLPKIKNFMTETEFIQSRAFCKIMSSIRYQKAIDNFDNTYRSSQSEIVERVLEKFNKQRDILREYTRKNGKDIPNNLLQELKEIAQLQNLYDRSLDDVYNEFVKNTEKYSFISCLQKPRSWDDEEKAKYTKLVNSLLLMKQKYNNFEELEIEIKPKQEETILEEQLETA